MQILEGEGRTYWVASDGSSTYYIGQMVSVIAASKAQLYGTVLPLAVPAGAFDLTNYQIPIGIVVGINDRTPTYDATTGLQTVTGTYLSTAQVKARDYTGQEGMYIKGDRQVLLQITEVLPQSIIRAPIYNATYGVAPTLLTATTATSDGAVASAITTNACDFTNVAKCGTLFCRTGANQGLYRVSKDTSTTAHTVGCSFGANNAVGDTFVKVPLKQGASTIYIAGPGLFVDCSKNPVIAGTDLFGAFVYSMDLSTAGSETVDFRFNADHFCMARA